MTRRVNYIVVYGVTSRHLSESLGVFDRLRDAKQAFKEWKPFENYKAIRLIRLEYPDKWSGANDVRVLDEISA